MSAAPATAVPGTAAGGAASATAPREGPLLLGVRHHGPGSARAVRAALDAVRPKVVLVEGPPEGDALLPLAGDEAMRPPVALLAHVADDPRRAAFWPLAVFSPEWVAIRWALEHGVPVRFIDLPVAHTLAEQPDEAPDESTTESGGRQWPEAGSEPRGETEEKTGSFQPEGGTDPARAVPPEAAEEGAAGHRVPEPAALRADPLAVLARTAGYDDPERWWEDVVEHRSGGPAGDPCAPFDAVAEAMAVLREHHPEAGQDRDTVREAHMRIQLRAARKEFGQGGEVAVVCGAWHVPALAARTTATADRALLRGLPKVRTEMTWVPWTHRRLSRHSGYGAGIESPGWYRHLFEAADRPVERWLTKVAGLFRDEDMTVSSAHVIEAVRLAQSLAALRGRPLAGLTETMDAVRAVMCDGSDVPIALVADRLIVGDELGEVPDAAPAVPLQRDLTRQQRTLRIKAEAAERDLDLDLRKETDAGRSVLLHRLRILDIDWGEPTAGRATTGTFRESWRLRWEPELHVRVAEAGIWGTTVLGAAAARVEATAVAATALAEVTSLAEQCLLSSLPDALPVVMRALADRAALDADVGHLAQALPALARTLRYGDVRGTDTAALGAVARGLVERICVGLPPACAGLDADGAAEMRRHLDAVHTAVALLPGEPGDGGESGRSPAERWAGTLRKLAVRDSVAGVLRGRATRLLLDGGHLTQDDAARLMGLALSPAVPPADAAAWVEGFVGGASGGGMLLVHDERLLALVDTWLTAVPQEAFTDVLPLLRRTFASYEPGVRRTLGELIRRRPSEERGNTGAESTHPGFAPELDKARADAVLPLLDLLLAGTRSAAAGTPQVP